MLRAVSIFNYDREQWWYVSPLSGSLLVSGRLPFGYESRRLPKIIEDSLLSVDRPFQACAPWPFPDVSVTDAQGRKLEQMHDRLCRIGNRRFLLSLLYAGIRVPKFDTTQLAMAAVSKLERQKQDRDKLCLQRSLLVAKVSRSFSTSGVIFVGAHMRTGDMHAWIMEGGMQPDSEDRTWINYKPMLALYGGAP
jgi:hypothetical protein